MSSFHKGKYLILFNFDIKNNHDRLVNDFKSYRKAPSKRLYRFIALHKPGRNLVSGGAEGWVGMAGRQV